MKSSSSLATLTVAQMTQFPIWEDTYETENSVRPVHEFPVKTMDSRHACTQVMLRNGSHVWAILSQFSLFDERMTESLLTIRFKIGRRSFLAPRDMESDIIMQKRISAFLGVSFRDIYPIVYDISPFVSVRSAVTRGVIHGRRSGLVSGSEIAKHIVERGRKHLEAMGYIDKKENHEA